LAARVHTLDGEPLRQVSEKVDMASIVDEAVARPG
jgi:hypothetical protein